jgi:NlpC/P60 family protein/S-layer family protein
MAPSRPLRRLAAASLALACAVLAQVPIAHAADPRASRTLTGGDRGSGAPMLRLAPLPRRAADVTFSDLPADYWATTAIRYVAGANDWMRDWRAAGDGTFRFRPLKLESRQLFARAIVRAFAPTQAVDPTLSFADLDATSRFFAPANVAVQLGWMQVGADGTFRPTDPITTAEAQKALVDAVGLGELAAETENVHLRNGTTFRVPAGFGAMLIGMRIGLRYNHSDETLDVLPGSPLSRAEVAWSLYRAATMPAWMPDSLAPYANIQLPNLGPVKQRIVQWGIDYVGYPYVWGGEWDQPTTSDYCCGAQPVGGFDCSGLTWWLMRAGDATWSNDPPRPYVGWSLPQRTSTDMAAYGTDIAWDDLKPADLMFYDGGGDGRVDHVDTYIGNGWAIDSSSSPGGVTIMWVGTGWYADHFVHGRRILTGGRATPSPSVTPSPSPSPTP